MSDFTSSHSKNALTIVAERSPQAWRPERTTDDSAPFLFYGTVTSPSVTEKSFSEDVPLNSLVSSSNGDIFPQLFDALDKDEPSALLKLTNDSLQRTCEVTV